jgi:hypothetical protein
VRLDALLLRDPEMPRHAIGAGVEMRGDTAGILTHWIPTVDGDWLGTAPRPIAMMSDNGPASAAGRCSRSHPPDRTRFRDISVRGVISDGDALDI